MDSNAPRFNVFNSSDTIYVILCVELWCSFLFSSTSVTGAKPDSYTKNVFRYSQDLQQRIQLLHERHVSSLDSIKELFQALVVAGSVVMSTEKTVAVEESEDDFLWLIEALRHQPFTPNYANTTSPYISHLSSLLADQAESEQTEFLLLILQVLRFIIMHAT